MPKFESHEPQRQKEERMPEATRKAPASPPQKPHPANADKPHPEPPKPGPQDREPKPGPGETVPGRITHYENPDDTPVIPDPPQGRAKPIEVPESDVARARRTWQDAVGDIKNPGVLAVNPDPQPQEMKMPPPTQGNARLDTVLDLVPGLREVIAAQVKAALDAAGVSEKKIAAASNVYQINPNAPAWRPKAYLKHYRNDVFPQKRYIRMHVDHENDKLVQDRIDLGEYIQFANGHFFATDQRDVDQLEWMRTHPTHDRTGATVIGGDPSLYVDDESEDVLWCPECRKPFASASKMAAHRKATHNTSAVA